eukprot:7620732-Pyramimonas_sp.AAC.1
MKCPKHREGVQPVPLMQHAVLPNVGLRMSAVRCSAKGRPGSLLGLNLASCGCKRHFPSSENEKNSQPPVVLAFTPAATVKVRGEGG